MICRGRAAARACGELGVAVLLGFVCIASAPDLQSANADVSPTDIWQRWGDYSAGQQEQFEVEVAQLLETGTGPSACLPECSDTYLADLTSVGTEGQYPELAHYVYSGLDVAREDWIDAVPEETLLGDGTLTFTWPAVGQIAGAFIVGVAIGNEVDHWLGLPTVTGMFGSSVPDSIESVRFTSHGPYSAYGSPAGRWADFCTGPHGTGCGIGQPLEHGNIIPSWSNDVTDLGHKAYSIQGGWTWYVNPQWWQCSIYEECYPAAIGSYVPAELAVIPTGTQITGGSSAQAGVYAGQNDRTANAATGYPVAGTEAGNALFAKYGEDLSPLAKQQISHWVDSAHFSGNPISNPDNFPTYVLPNCSTLTGAQCEARIDELATGTPDVELTVAGIQGAVLEQPPDEVIGMTPEHGTTVRTDTVIHLTVNPHEMPFVIPAIQTGDDYQSYSARFPGTAVLTQDVLPDAEGDPTRGPEEVTQVQPVAGTRVASDGPVTIKTNPSDWPTPGGGGGRGCPAPLPTAIDLSPLHLTGLQDKFPFAIVSWLYYSMHDWSGERSAPTVDLPIPFESEPMHLSLAVWNGDPAAIIRAVLLAVSIFFMVAWLATSVLGFNYGGGD